MLNGVTKIVMTKADVLDKFEQLEVCVAYSKAGEEITEIPLRLDLDHYVPVYSSQPGWNTVINSVKDYAGLPEKTQQYISFINTYLGIPVKYLSNGPEREQLILL